MSGLHRQHRIYFILLALFFLFSGVAALWVGKPLAELFNHPFPVKLNGLVWCLLGIPAFLLLPRRAVRLCGLVILGLGMLQLMGAELLLSDGAPSPLSQALMAFVLAGLFVAIPLGHDRLLKIDKTPAPR